MTLDELVQAFRAVSTEQVTQGLARLLLDWKANDSTADKLRDRVERLLGNTWTEREEDHSEIDGLWPEFRDHAIAGIEGMTMNERLYCFGLLERFDAARDDDEKLAIYRKLHASP